MFKKGEKVVCINNGEIINKNRISLSSTTKLEKYKTYTVDFYNVLDDNVLLKEIHAYFYKTRFISLIEYRKLQINKIKEICSKTVKK